MSSQHNENGIPVLTEIIGAPVYGVDLPERRIAPYPMVNGAAAMSALAPDATAESAPRPVEDLPTQMAPGRLDASALGRIEREVAERVLQQLMGRVDFVLEQRIRDSLADVLQTAVDGLACQLRFGLKETLEDVVARAITQEIKKLQSSK